MSVTVSDTFEIVKEPFDSPHGNRRTPWSLCALAAMEGKARAVIGMRRAGKTTFRYQVLATRLAEGVARERLVYFNFEDERLGDLEAADLGEILEEYYRSYPEFRRCERVTWLNRQATYR